jgi:hypothetical protein
MTGLSAIQGTDTRPRARHPMGRTAFISKFIVVAKKGPRA